MLKLAAAFMAVFLCLNFAYAQTAIVFGGLSKHTTSRADNEFHRTFIIDHNNWFAGYFRNSFNDDSFALGKAFVRHESDFDVALNTGLVYGYRKSGKCYKTQSRQAGDPKILCPLVAPELRLKSLPLEPSISLYGFDALVLNLRIEL